MDVISKLSNAYVSISVTSPGACPMQQADPCVATGSELCPELGKAEESRIFLAFKLRQPEDELRGTRDVCLRHGKSL